MRKFRNFLFKRKRGSADITFEAVMGMLLWCGMLMATIWIINVQKNQKLMYNTFISTAMQVSKWGGTNTTMMAANGKNYDIVDNMSSNIKMTQGVNNGLNSRYFTISASPEVITSYSDKIHVEMSWVDQGFASVCVPSWVSTNTHHISGEFRSVVKPGILLKKAN